MLLLIGEGEANTSGNEEEAMMEDCNMQTIISNDFLTSNSSQIRINLWPNINSQTSNSNKLI